MTVVTKFCAASFAPDQFRTLTRIWDLSKLRYKQLYFCFNVDLVALVDLVNLVNLVTGSEVCKVQKF